MKSDIRRRRIISALQSGFGSDATTILYDLYPSTDLAVLAGTAPAGTGARGYLSFGGQAVNNTTGDLYFAYSAQDDHNSTKNGHGMAVRSTDLWATHATPVQIVANPGGGINIQDLDIFVTSTGRIIIFYTKSPTGVGESIGYYKYTDNADLSGLSAEQRLTLDYSGVGDFIDTTGSCVEIGGIIYKTCWGAQGGGTEIPVYQSSDNGVSWTLKSLIGTAAENYDETCLALHPNGRVWAAIRDNASQELLIKYSDDNLTTWSAVISTGIGAKAKHGFVISPQGMFCVVTRDAPGLGRTVLIQSRNGTDWTKQNIDGRTGIYIYGTPVYHPSAGIIATWCVEAANVPVAGSSGPSLIIAKSIAQSATSVSPPTVYDVDYQCWLDYLQANSATLPPDALKTKHNTLISTLRTNGKWTPMDGVYITKHNDATLSSASQRNITRAWITAVLGGSPTYGVLGFDFDGVDDFFRLNMILSQQVNFQQNSACLVYYTDDAGTGAIAGAVSGGNSTTQTNAVFLNPDNSNSVFAALNNNTTGSIANGGAPFNGLWELNRSASGGFTVTKDGTLLGTISIASSGVVAGDFHVGCERFADILNFFSTRSFGLIAIGGSKTSWNTEWAAYIASL